MKKIVYAFIALFTAFTSLGQQSNTFLYKIEGNGLEKPSYLFGTIHLMCQSDFQISEALKSAGEQTEQLVLELDMDDPQMMMKMQQNMMMTGGETLDNFISEEDYQTVADYFKTNVGIPLDAVKQVKPFMTMSMLYPSLLGCPLKTYEQELTVLAQGESKEVIGLETVAEQLGFIDAISLEEQAEILVKSVKEIDDAKAEFDRMIKSYLSEDLEELETIMEESKFSFENLEEKLLTNRNQNWVAAIPKIIAEQSSLIAVGAGHLLGEKGLLKLLKAEGYEITPVH
ncbi:TraB/GumN family protein [Jiulongibacter sp. NS-SX5]|uniref:TraB/GumN family protein n=1 Tax=Jiulongibacter sp. NS-SX5 TaxID=3463854 RepID=UPI004058D668